MPDALDEWAAIVVTLFLAYFAHNQRRQTRTQLADARRAAYAELWQITGLAAPIRLDPGGSGPLTLAEQKRLYGEMTTWYYQNGNGMLLGRTTREVYLNAKRNLLSAPDDLRPPTALILCATEPARNLDSRSSNACAAFDLGVRRVSFPYPRQRRIRHLRSCKPDPKKTRQTFRLLDLFPQEVPMEKRPGCLSIRQLSLLRTQMKTDLATYGVPWVESLHLHERAFLTSSGVRLHPNPLLAPLRYLLTLIRVMDPNPWLDAARLPVKEDYCGFAPDDRVTPMLQLSATMEGVDEPRRPSHPAATKEHDL